MEGDWQGVCRVWAGTLSAGCAGADAPGLPQVHERGRDAPADLQIVMQAEPREDLADVLLDRLLREAEPIGDARVREAVGEQRQDLELALR